MFWRDTRVDQKTAETGSPVNAECNQSNVQVQSVVAQSVSDTSPEFQEQVRYVKSVFGTPVKKRRNPLTIYNY